MTIKLKADEYRALRKAMLKKPEPSPRYKDDERRAAHGRSGLHQCNLDFYVCYGKCLEVEITMRDL